MRLLECKQLILLVGLLAATIIAHSGNQEKHLGKKFILEETTPILELIEHPDKYFNKDVKVEGIIASACTNEGCFIEVVSKDGKGEWILVNFPELTHKFPTDCAGYEVVVEGMFYQKIYPESRVHHWQGHSFKKGIKIPEFSLIKRINARAVSIGAIKLKIAHPTEINRAAINRIDLNAMEFEADGFGAGKKLLISGDSTEEHSSGNYREIVFCLEGVLTIIKQGDEAVTLNSGEITYIPPDTKHSIKNLSDKPAVYLFVFSRKIELEKKGHEH
jgi:quercetin dioxygenase-like cupin family protein